MKIAIKSLYLLLLLCLNQATSLGALKHARPILRGLNNSYEEFVSTGRGRCGLNYLFQLLAPIMHTWEAEKAFKHSTEPSSDNPIPSYLQDLRKYQTKSAIWPAYTLKSFHEWWKRNDLDYGNTNDQNRFIKKFCYHINKSVHDPSKHSIEYLHITPRDEDIAHSQSTSYILPRSLDEEFRCAQKNSPGWPTSGPPSWKHIPGAFFVTSEVLRISTGLPYMVAKHVRNKLPHYSIPTIIDMGPFLANANKEKHHYELIGILTIRHNHNNPAKEPTPPCSGKEEHEAFSKAYTKFLSAKDRQKAFTHGESIVRDINNRWVLCDDENIYKISAPGFETNNNSLELFPGVKELLLYKKTSEHVALNSSKTKTPLIIESLPLSKKIMPAMYASIGAGLTTLPGYFMYQVYSLNTPPELALKFGVGAALWSLACGYTSFNPSMRQEFKKKLFGQRFSGQ